MPPAAQFCKRGHDTEEVGRYGNGTCRACTSEGGHGSSRFARNRSCVCQRCLDALERSAMRKPTFPIGPLLPFLPKYETGSNGRRDNGYGTIGGISSAFSTSDARTLWRIIKEGWITPYEADRYAVLLGRHPSEIWTSWFDEKEEACSGELASS